MSSKDTIYSDQQDSVKAFEFDQKVVEVFPDMIERSVPGYKTIIQGIGEIAQKFIQLESNVYDLGCSLGAASFAIRQKVPEPSCKIIAVDNSQAMVERCRLIQSSYSFEMPIEVVEADINKIDMENASLVVLNFTLQFLPTEQRQQLIDKIYQALKPGGALVLSEKLQMQHEPLDETIIELHHQFKKRNGYSDMEIAQKRAALENVLIPDQRQQHFERFAKAGFTQFDSWFQHYNFSSFLAVK
ncbi:MAG: carboxy-S-adenosyl-L-methionine synthase CmoA [Gammaproteobacteria bacterium]|nr:carboxy-S-adenosyl-L-methionine synthase CmoA [Gammaproteobacteria bacterium]